MPRIFVLLPLILSLVGCNGGPPTASRIEVGPRARALVAPGRLVAIGDLHGDLARTRQVLRMAGLVDEADRWIGGNSWVVQTGDLTDKGPDTRAVLDLWMSLEKEAAAAGGRAIVLVSNHEALNVTGVSGYVSDDDVLDFLPAGNTDRTAGEATVAELEEGAEARRVALGPQGVYGRWIASHDAIVVVGDTVFLHGGLTPEQATRGLPALNAEIRAYLAAGRYEGLLEDREGPLWYRGYLRDAEDHACPRLARALAIVGAKRMVVGHTPQTDGRIGTRCGGRLIAIDTGIAAVMGGAPSALELTGGDAKAMHADGVVDLPDP